MKKILISLLCGIAFISPSVLATSISFPDVPATQWFYQDVMNMVDWGVIKGNSNGTFGPNNNVNRAELSAMWNRYNEYLKTQFVTKNNTSTNTNTSTNSNTSISTSNNEAQLQFEPFQFDGFEWKILGTKKYTQIGSDSNLQSPENNYFLIVEAEIKNTTNTPKYFGDFSVINNADGKQHDDSSSVSVYGEYQMGYGTHSGTVEAQAKVKTFFGFDVDTTSNDFLLIIKPWGFGNERAQVKIKVN